MNLVFAAHDPGGANAIHPIIVAAMSRKMNVRLFAAGPAVEIWSSFVDLVECAAEDAPSALLDGFHSDAVITGTSLHVDFEKRFWEIDTFTASIAVIDAWGNLKARFERIKDGVLLQPDLICVVDEGSRQTIEAEGWARRRPMVIGQPYLDEKARRLAPKWRRRAEAKHTTITFFSEPIERDEPVSGVRGYDKFTVFQSIVDCLPETRNFRILIKPHPREEIDDWVSFIRSVDVPEHIEVSLADEGSEVLLVSSDCVIGMASMALLEAVSIGIPAASLEPGRNKSFNPGIDDDPRVLKATRWEDMGGVLSALLTDSPDEGASLVQAPLAPIRILEEAECMVQEKGSNRV